MKGHMKEGTITLRRASKLTPQRVTVIPSWVFVVLKYFEKSLPQVDSLLWALQDEVNIMSWGACDVVQNGGQDVSPPGLFVCFLFFFFTQN